jgi:hypothetical protein
VRVTVSGGMLDDCGWLTSEAENHLRMLLWSVPDRAPVTFDLGPSRHVNSTLINTLSLLPCANQVTFEAADWRIAYDAALELGARLAADRQVA